MAEKPLTDHRGRPLFRLVRPVANTTIDRLLADDAAADAETEARRAAGESGGGK